MNELWKNKKNWISLIVISIVVIVLAIIFFVMKDRNEVNNKDKGNYVAYVKINPLVKLTFNISNCEDSNNCDNFTTEVMEVTSLNDEALDIYRDLDFKDKKLEEVIVALILMAKENNYNIEDVNITTNWSDSEDYINKKIKDKLTNTETEVQIKVNYQKKLNEKEIINNYEKKYIVSFDSDGGSDVAKETIIQNKLAIKPSNPTKEGYNFIEWQLDGKTYNFDSKVVKDITLKAKWEKITESNENTTDNGQTGISQKEKDNATLKQQLKEKGLVWDFNTKEEAYHILDIWSGGYGGEVLENSYGESDIAYTVRVTLNTVACGGSEIIDIDWRNNQPVDFIYYLYSKGYNCSGNTGYYNGRHFVINENNELIYD